MRIVLLVAVALVMAGCENFAITGGVTFPGGRIGVTRDGKTTVVGIDLDGKAFIRPSR